MIKRVIDECDYYVLIIGGRYGHVITEEGISYTEKEYRYAKKSGIPVLAFVHGKPDEIPVGKTEKDEASRRKLEAFRAEVMKEHPIRQWSSASELGGLVSRSLVREIKISPRPGWIRNDGSSPVALLEQINILTAENQEFRSELASVDSSDSDHTLESGPDKVRLRGTRNIENPTEYYSTQNENLAAEVSWDDIFRDLGPALINETTEAELRKLLSRFHVYSPVKKGYKFEDSDYIDLESWNEVLVQLRALGYIDQGVKKRGVNDRNSYWRITTKGDKHLVSLLARRKKVPVDDT